MSTASALDQCIVWGQTSETVGTAQSEVINSAGKSLTSLVVGKNKLVRDWALTVPCEWLKAPISKELPGGWRQLLKKLTDKVLIYSSKKWLFQCMPKGRYILVRLWIWTYLLLTLYFFYSSGGDICKYWWNILGDLKELTATSGGNLHLLVQLKFGVAINKSMQKGPKLL